jgi:F-type H+-transporting ATPase subunit a
MMLIILNKINALSTFLSPLEQFKVVPIVYLIFESTDKAMDFTISNIIVFLFFNFLIVCLLVGLSVFKSRLIPTRLRVVIEDMFQFVVEIIRQQTARPGLRYTVFYFLVFFFILTANLVGLLPFAFTTTSHLIIVSYVALTANLAFVLIGFSRHGLSFLKLFFPSSAPKPLIPLITVIEFVSYLIRTFSLSLRLFANMMAGHILLYILASFVLRLMSAGLVVASFVPIVLMIGVFALEFGICCIQAYVFLVLLSIYLSDSISSPGH